LGGLRSFQIEAKKYYSAKTEEQEHTWYQNVRNFEAYTRPIVMQPRIEELANTPYRWSDESS